MKVIVIIFNALVWTLLLIVGVNGYISIVHQRVAGFPNGGQTVLYMGIPGFAVGISVALVVLSYKYERFRFYSSVLSAVLLIGVLPYLIMAAGGV